MPTIVQFALNCQRRFQQQRQWSTTIDNVKFHNDVINSITTTIALEDLILYFCCKLMHCEPCLSPGSIIVAYDDVLLLLIYRRLHRLPHLHLRRPPCQQKVDLCTDDGDTGL
ncbi:unnamed protein product [Nippostrongylus brasiliensis]|uniref:Uncharacterized protein n=1 Tax=Nippostrongylus brasiliensis TaxID=27835 RepID=A0A0N4YI57_NIPBR|nr:unnamed protein product [Nippostrongylus brasiliensis]